MMAKCQYDTVCRCLLETNSRTNLSTLVHWNCTQIYENDPNFTALFCILHLKQSTLVEVQFINKLQVSLHRISLPCVRL